MANNTGVKGKVVDEKGKGIEGLDIVAVDLDPFFTEQILGTKKTLPDGSFEITYSASKYGDWLSFRNPDIVVRVYGPGWRLLHETPEKGGVMDPMLTLTTIEIHRANIEGWLVTNATLNPKNPLLNPDGTPVTWTTGNDVEILMDGEEVFPKITEEVNKSTVTNSINLMNMNFWISKQLITKFDKSFNPDNPPLNQPTPGERIHEVLKMQADDPKKNISVNVLVQDVPFVDQVPVISTLLRIIFHLNPDTADEVKQFFQGSKVKIRTMESFRILARLINFMHAKLLIIDGKLAFVMGSTLSQAYFSDQRHLITDARHRGSLIHDINLKLVGPAVEHVDRSFTALWNAADSSASSLSPATGQGKVASGIGVQVVRTLPGGIIDSVPHGETGALESYQRAISQAKKYVYLEDQYITAPEIFTSLLERMKQKKEAPDLEIIIVMNAKPDVSGYPELQIQLLKQLQSDLTKVIGKAAVEKRLGVYTLWSCNEQKNPYEIMPIYVHAKVAIIDDIWATIGSTNLDGTSLNKFQIETFIEGKLADAVGKGCWLKRILLTVIFTLLNPLIIAIVAGGKIGFARPTQHANPNQSRQPSRSTEVNVTICEKTPNVATPNAKVVDFRKKLWEEHLGLSSLPAPAKGWVKIWNDQADAKKADLQTEPLKPAKQRKKHPAKVLRWQPKVEAKDYLKAELSNIDRIKIREEADKFNFVEGKWEMSSTSWLIRLLC